MGHALHTARHHAAQWGAMDDPVANLIEVLGPGVTRARATALLRDADGSLDTAIAIFFSSAIPSAPEAGGGRAAELQSLRELLGDGPSLPELQELLSRAGNSAEAAIELYFAGGAAPAGPAGEGAGQGRGPVILRITVVSSRGSALG
jgi:hypothetical protein